MTHAQATFSARDRYICMDMKTLVASRLHLAAWAYAARMKRVARSYLLDALLAATCHRYGEVVWSRPLPSTVSDRTARRPASAQARRSLGRHERPRG
jgi:hypothetical protein